MHLAIILWVITAIEAAVYGHFLYNWWYAGETPIGTVLLLIAAIFLGIRSVIVAQLFSVAWFCRSERPKEMQIGPLGTIRLIVAEWLSLTALYLVFHPFFFFFSPRGPNTKIPSGDPVLFVHGFMCNQGFWWAMRRALQREGITNTYTISLQPLFTSIERYANQVDERVNEILEETGAEKITLVGHSMGGLVSRAYARRPEAQGKVAKVIALGSPHHGTAHAQWSHSPNAKQMRRFNDWIEKLNQEEQNPPDYEMICVYSWHDDLVAPAESAALAHAKNIAFAGIGHLEMTFSRKFQRAVAEELGT